MRKCPTTIGELCRRHFCLLPSLQVNFGFSTRGRVVFGVLLEQGEGMMMVFLMKVEGKGVRILFFLFFLESLFSDSEICDECEITA